jgi:hypothetical protein
LTRTDWRRVAAGVERPLMQSVVRIGTYLVPAFLYIGVLMGGLRPAHLV